MTKTKSTKRALLTSALALLMCVSMLIGSTFAWFTDSVTSGGNIIKSGTLEVTMKWADGKTDPTNTTWTDASTGPIFKSELWEPGYTEVRHIKIANEGTLALKYQLNILANGEVSELAKVIDVYYLDPAEQLAERASIPAEKKLGTLAEVLDNISTSASGNLLSGENHTVTLALKMQETAGNEYQDKAIGSNFSIQLLATQYTYEDDSFDDQYDANATLGTYVELEAGGDLLAAMASAEADMPLTIKLNGNVAWPTDNHHGENDITPASSILIDGNGYTLTATGSGVTPLGDSEAPMTLKNVKVVDDSVSYAEDSWEFSYLEMGGTVLNCVNVDFADPIMVESDTATFAGCSFVGHNDKVSTTTTQYGVWVYNGNSTYTNCTFTGTRGMKICDEYAGEVGTVVIDGCTFSGISEKPGVCIDDAEAQDMKVTIKNSTFINCQAGDQNLYVYETDDIVPTVENNTVLNDVSGVIATKADLAALSGTRISGTYVLAGNIDMAGAEFNAIIVPRGGELTFLGNGHTISNVNIVSGSDDNTTGQASLFYAYSSAKLNVSDLTLKDLIVTADENASGYAAAVIGYCEGTAVLDNVDVVNATVNGAKSSGMLAGHLSGSLTATDCDVSGTVALSNYENGGHYAGKYIGTAAGAAALNNCTASVTVSGNLNAANDGVIYGRKTAAGSLTIDGAAQKSAATQEELTAAVSSGNNVALTLADGNYTMPTSFDGSGVSLQGKTVTITGTKDTVIDVSDVSANDQYVTSATLVFDGVTLNFGYENYMGFANTVSLTYKNCKINGLQFLYGENVTFENCVIDSSANTKEPHSVWTYGAKNVSFTECDFIYGDRAVNCFKDQDIEGGKQVVNFKNCTFTTTVDNSEGAVEINSSAFSIGIEVNMEGCTAPANGQMAYVSQWDSTNGAKTTINIQ